MIDISKIRLEKPINELLNFSLINIDKPSGPTSFFVSNYVRKQLKLTKTAHFGTLDPQVTGVLPVALGRARRLNEYFMHKNKTYVGVMRLHKSVNDKELKEVISKFIGKIKQLPPVRSSVKRAVREREIISFDILEREDKDILFSTEVQAGTYIRKLCDDMGKEIGGAHMLELRRIKAGILSEENIVNLYDFDKAIEEYSKGNENPLRKILIPAEIVTSILHVVEIKPSMIKELFEGKPLMKSDKLNLPESDRFCLVCKDKLIGIYKKVDEGNIVARAEFVCN